MLVSGDNNSSKYKVTNPVSLNNKQSPNFKGHALLHNEKGQDVYSFFLPNKQKADVEFVILKRNEDGEFETFNKKEPKKMSLINGRFDIEASEALPGPGYALGYRFLLKKGNRTDIYLDNTAKNTFDDKKIQYNIAIPADRSAQLLPRQMIHLFPDSLVDGISNEKRNHFNHLGGDLKSIIKNIDVFKDFGANRILGTPIYGMDITSHGYWTNNGYQVTDTMGDLSDFKKLQTELYRRSMGWVADGAFVNEGLQGVHLKDLFNWGEQSPFIHMFDTTDIKNIGIKIGILPKQEETKKYVKIKLINAPYKIEFVKTEDGFAEKAVVKNSYDPKKPTFIQVFDERLVTPEQVKQETPFLVYDKKNAADKNQINNYKDSVQPYSFRVSPKDVRKNYEKYEEELKAHKKGHKSGIEFKDYLRSWTNFEIVPSNEDGAMALWVGNSDIAKRRFMISDNKILQTPANQRDEMIAGQYQVQDDIVQIGKYWTAETARTLVSYTSELIGQKLEKGKKYDEAVKELIQEGKLPATASSVLDEVNGSTALKNILKTNPATGKRLYTLKPVAQPQNVTEGIMDFPIDSVEVSLDLTSVLAYPFLKNFAVSDETVGKSRYELYSMKDKFYNEMPARYRKIYKEMDSLIAGTKSSSPKESFTGQAVEILKEAGQLAGFEIVDKNGNLTEEGKEIYPLFASDVAKFLYVKSMAPEIGARYTIGDTGKPEFSFDRDVLRDLSLERFSLQNATSPDDAAQKMLGIFKEGIKNISAADKTEFAQFLAKRMDSLDSDTINVAKLIVERSESGLDWRIDAAKDVGDWDSVQNHTFDEKECFDRTAMFWRHFNTGIRQHNPKAYTIGELVLDMKPAPTEEKKDKARRELWGAFEGTFLNRTGFTTKTNYTNLFSTPQKLYGSEAEQPGSERNMSHTTDSLLANFLYSGLLDSVNFSHVFTGNHDKPRILHTMALDTSDFYNGNDGNGVRGDDSAKAIAVRNLFFKTLDSNEECKVLGPYRETINDALKDLANGKYDYKQIPKNFDPEDFGVRPFDESIDDVFNLAASRNGKFATFKNNNPKEMDKIKAGMLRDILSPAMTKYTSILFYQTGMPGQPTVYAGDELGETGWETLSKNEKQQNRARVKLERLTDPNYKFVQDYRNNLANIFKIRNQKGGSALVDGSTLVLASQMLEGKNGSNASVVYRYNDRTDAICVFHNSGYGPKPEEQGSNESVKAIYLDRHNDRTGLPNGLESDTSYYDALNPNNKYKAVFDKDEKKFKIVASNGGNIPLGNRGIILLREYGFNGEHYLTTNGDKNIPSFVGTNKLVDVANIKYSPADLAKRA